MEKKYQQPVFELVRQDQSNKVFFTASGGPSPASVSGVLGSIGISTGEWE